MPVKSRGIVLLHQAVADDAPADERDTLDQADQIATALRGRGWRVATRATGLDFAATLAAIAEHEPDCVFNLVESLDGDGRLIYIVPDLLRAAGLACSGCSSEAIFLSTQKTLAKQWMRAHGILTPDWFDAASSPRDGEVNGRWIVKSATEHASFGMDDQSVVSGVAGAQARIEQCRAKHGGDWFAERYVEGREFNISVIEENGAPRVLPLAEIDFVDFPADKPRIVGYAAKWDPDAPEYHATRRAFPELEAHRRRRIEQVVGECWQAFGLGGYARVDLRVDADGRPWVLEVNANPCLARDAGLAHAAARAGIDYETLVEGIVQAALPSAHAARGADQGPGLGRQA